MGLTVAENPPAILKVVGDAVTVNDAPWLTIEPAEFDIRTVYVPALLDWTLGMDNEELVAPEISESLNNHWKVSGAVPSVPTENVAVSPMVMLWELGCVKIVGATVPVLMSVRKPLIFRPDA